MIDVGLRFRRQGASKGGVSNGIAVLADLRL
jgi:hypothetical protein